VSALIDQKCFAGGSWLLGNVRVKPALLPSRGLPAALRARTARLNHRPTTGRAKSPRGAWFLWPLLQGPLGPIVVATGLMQQAVPQGFAGPGTATDIVHRSGRSSRPTRGNRIGPAELAAGPGPPDAILRA
jgi:hypothetical protein